MFTLRVGTWEQRCPCCRKKTIATMGYFLNAQPIGWDNFMGREGAASLAREGICPWCGRHTTIVARILVTRFRAMSDTYEREML